MSRRMPADPAKGPGLRLEVQRSDGRPIALEADDIVELRRSIRVVRCMVERRLATLKSADALDEAGWPVDPLDDNAVRFSLPGAFLRANRSRTSLYVAWMRLCNAAAAQMLGDPTAGLFDYNDDPDIDQDALLDLLDEVAARLDRLKARH